MCTSGLTQCVDGGRESGLVVAPPPQFVVGSSCTCLACTVGEGACGSHSRGMGRRWGLLLARVVCESMCVFARVCVREQVAGEWGVPKPPAITLLDYARVLVRIAGSTPAPALLVVEGVEVQQECGTVTVVAPTATEVELTLAIPSEGLRLRWMSGGVGGPWSSWAVSEHIALTSWCHDACTSWVLCDS